MPGASTATTLKLQAASTPMAIRLNMLRFIVRNERTPRTRNGQPDQRMTGVPSTNSAHIAGYSPIQPRTARPTYSPIARISSGTVSTKPTQNRRVKSMSSGFGPSSAAGIPFGSSAMPQIGQSPGPTCSISGCIGQV